MLVSGRGLDDPIHMLFPCIDERVSGLHGPQRRIPSWGIGAYSTNRIWLLESELCLNIFQGRPRSLYAECLQLALRHVGLIGLASIKTTPCRE